MSKRAMASMAVAGSLLAALVVTVRVEAQQRMMPMPSVAIESPANGATVTGNTIDVTVKPSNFTISCKDVGKTGDAPTQGHVHAMVDGLDMEHLSNMYCSNHFSISTAGLKPGKHTLAVVLADDAHAMASAPAMASFNYAPSSTLSLPAASTGTASVQILSPKSGATVAKKFNVTLAVHDFNLSCDAEGRQDVPGVGHIHIFAYQAGATDKKETAPMVAMMSTDNGKMLAQKLMQETGMSASDLNMMASMTMPALLGMPCTKTIPVDLSGWNSGPTRIVVQLAQDDHMPAPSTKPAVININLK